MGAVFFILFVICAFVFFFLIGSYILYLVSKWFKLDATYKKSLAVFFESGAVSFLASLILFFSFRIATSLVSILSFFIFHYFLSRQYKNSWLKSVSIYIIFSLIFFLVSLVVVIPIRLFVAQPFVASGDSMAPAYPSGEYLIINEISKTFARGDVVVFRYPKNPTEFFIKRIVGLPGETLQFKNGQILIDGKVLTDPRYIGELQNSAPTVLSSDQYFVLGDNFSASNDSRSFGPIEKSSILGKVWFDVTKF